MKKSNLVTIVLLHFYIIKSFMMLRMQMDTALFVMDKIGSQQITEDDHCFFFPHFRFNIDKKESLIKTGLDGI